MSEQIRDYISLKPIADRFREVAETFDDKEIREIIESEMKNQIKKQLDFADLGSWIETILEDWLDEEENVFFVRDLIKKSIKERLGK